MSRSNGHPPPAPPPTPSPGGSRPYRGPKLVLNHAEVKRVHHALTGATDPLATEILTKCAAALASDDRFRRPT